MDIKLTLTDDQATALQRSHEEFYPDERTRPAFEEFAGKVIGDRIDKEFVASWRRKDAATLSESLEKHAGKFSVEDRATILAIVGKYDEAPAAEAVAALDSPAK